MTSDLLQEATRVALVGIGATAVMDLWLLLQKQRTGRPLNFALVGRWVGHVLHGRWVHASIAKSTPVRGEAVWGWLFHYAVGIAFAALLVLICGAAWTESPSLLPALAVGVGTVAAPLFVLQPAMGGGIASSRTPSPLANSLRSLANHAVFGVGLYLSAVCIGWIAR